MGHRTVLRGATLLPCDGRQAIRRTDLSIDGGRIAAVGGVSGAALEGATVVEIKGVLVPGWIDGHLHLDEVLLDKRYALSPDPRARSEIELSSFRKALGAEGQRVSTKAGLGAALPVGTLAVGDPSGAALGDPLSALSAAVRVVSAIDARVEDPERILDRVSEQLRREPDGARLGISLYVGDAERAPLSLLGNTAQLAKRRGLRMIAHLGTRPDDRNGLQRLERAGALGPELVVAHGTGAALLDPRRVRALVDSGATLVLTPAFELLTGAPLPEIDRLFTAGVTCALGTESGATRLGFDIAEEARILYRILRGRTERPASLALEAATKGGGRALGLKIGTLEVGQHADFILYDLDVVEGEDHETLARRVLHHSPSRIVKAWVDGQVVWDRGRLLPFAGPTAEAVEGARQRGIQAIREAEQRPGSRLVRLLDWLERPIRRREGWHTGRLPLSAQDPRGE